MTLAEVDVPLIPWKCLVFLMVGFEALPLFRRRPTGSEAIAEFAHAIGKICIITWSGLLTFLLLELVNQWDVP